jgi:hypothetical protein
MIKDVNIQRDTILFGNDSIVIRKYIAGIQGGRALDTTDWAEDSVKSSHVIIKNKEGNYAPMPVADGKYAALPEGAAYAGVLYRSIATKDAQASIMTHGVVNPEAMPYPIDDIKEAFLAAVPHISFESDEEA